MRLVYSRSLLKRSLEQHFRMPLGTPIFRKIGRSSTGIRDSLTGPTSFCQGLTDYVLWGTQNTRTCWNEDPKEDWEPLTKLRKSASKPPIGINSTSTCA